VNNAKHSTPFFVQNRRLLSVPGQTLNFFHRVFNRICEKEGWFPTVFSTFSTEFSTIPVFLFYTLCILFPDFPKVSGEKRGGFFFFPKESRGLRFIFHDFLF